MPQSRHMHYIRHCNEYKKNPYCQWFKKGQCESIYIKQHFFFINILVYIKDIYETTLSICG